MAAIPGLGGGIDSRYIYLPSFSDFFIIVD